jgi:hypothetical protein
MERITATFDARTLAAIRKVAGPRGVSAFLQQAARERLARLQVLEVLDALDQKHGPPSADVAEEVAADARVIFAAGSSTAARRPRARR